MATEPWATVRVELDPAHAAADGTDLALEGLAAWVAELPGVGGVETRDATTLGGPATPELCVYTSPAVLAAVSEAIKALAPRFGLAVRVTGQVHTDDDWRDAWKQFYRPAIFGEGPARLLLRPSWVARRPDDPTREVVLDPGHAFGTGLHQSTRLCLAALGRMAASSAEPATILDLGCGSGILSLAAARLFPDARVTAIDIDPEAVATTDDNAARNGLSDRITTQPGVIADLAPHPCSLVIANIRPVVLIPLAEAIDPWLAPGAQILLSGIFGDEVDAVAAAWSRPGRAPARRHEDTGWWLLHLEAGA